MAWADRIAHASGVRLRDHQKRVMRERRESPVLDGVAQPHVPVGLGLHGDQVEGSWRCSRKPLDEATSTPHDVWGEQHAHLIEQAYIQKGPVQSRPSIDTHGFDSAFGTKVR